MTLATSIQAWNEAENEFHEILVKAYSEREEKIPKKRTLVRIKYKLVRYVSLEIQVEGLIGDKWTFIAKRDLSTPYIRALWNIPFCYGPKPVEDKHQWHWDILRRNASWRFLRRFLNPAAVVELINTMVRTLNPITGNCTWVYSAEHEWDPDNWSKDIPDHVKTVEYLCSPFFPFRLGRTIQTEPSCGSQIGSGTQPVRCAMEIQM